MEYDERIESKIDTLTSNLHELDKRVLTIEHSIGNIQNQLNSLPQVIENINSKLKVDETNNVMKIWLAPLIIGIVIAVVTAVLTIIGTN